MNTNRGKRILIEIYLNKRRRDILSEWFSLSTRDLRKIERGAIRDLLSNRLEPKADCYKDVLNDETK